MRRVGDMSEKPAEDSQEQVVVVGPDGQPMGTLPASVIAQATSGGDDDANGRAEILVGDPGGWAGAEELHPLSR